MPYSARHPNFVLLMQYMCSPYIVPDQNYYSAFKHPVYFTITPLVFETVTAKKVENNSNTAQVGCYR